MVLQKIEIAQKFFKRIHTIEVREWYSDSEINPLLKELERLNENEWTNLRFQIDQYWRDKDDLVLRKIALGRIRQIFHFPLKQAGLDPLKS